MKYTKRFNRVERVEIYQSQMKSANSMFNRVELVERVEPVVCRGRKSCLYNRVEHVEPVVCRGRKTCLYRP